MIQWIFFDLGSTLIDETDCIEYRDFKDCNPDNQADNASDVVHDNSSKLIFL